MTVEQIIALLNTVQPSKKPTSGYVRHVQGIICRTDESENGDYFRVSLLDRLFIQFTRDERDDDLDSIKVRKFARIFHFILHDLQ